MTYWTSTGTTNFSNSNTSTLVVSNVTTDTSVVKYVERNFLLKDGSNQYVRIRGDQVDSSGVTVSGGSTPNASTIFQFGPSFNNYFNQILELFCLHGSTIKLWIN